MKKSLETKQKNVTISSQMFLKIICDSNLQDIYQYIHLFNKNSLAEYLLCASLVEGTKKGFQQVSFMLKQLEQFDQGDESWTEMKHQGLQNEE